LRPPFDTKSTKGPCGGFFFNFVPGASEKKLVYHGVLQPFCLAVVKKTVISFLRRTQTSGEKSMDTLVRFSHPGAPQMGSLRGFQNAQGPPPSTGNLVPPSSPVATLKPVDANTIRIRFLIPNTYYSNGETDLFFFVGGPCTFGPNLSPRYVSCPPWI